MAQSITIVGGGICGMCTAVELDRAGFDVTLFERDAAPPEGDADQAFFQWQRRGAAQFRHPHAFLGLLCSLLEEHHPELLAEMLAAGARRLDYADTVPPRLQAQYTPEPGDEKLWILLCRRATMETVLRRYVARATNVEFNNDTYVTDAIIDKDGEVLSLRGVETTDRKNANTKRTVAADIVVDASGRSSKFPGWLRAAGASIAEECEDAEIVYYTRHYKLEPGVSEPPRHREHANAGDLGYMKYGVFPGDGGHFAVIICLPLAETELREAIKHGPHFDAILRKIPGVEPWVAAGKATATTEPFGIGRIQAVWRDFVRDGEPEVLNFFAVGDAYSRTNPLYGRGCSTGVLHAHLLSDVLTSADDPIERATSYADKTVDRLRPIYDASLREDERGIARADAVRQGLDRNKADSLQRYFALAFADALAAAARDRIHVHRGIMRTVNLVEKPGAFLEGPAVRRTIYRYMLRGRRRNGQMRLQRGPTRNEMLDYVATLAAPS